MSNPHAQLRQDLTVTTTDPGLDPTLSNTDTQPIWTSDQQAGDDLYVDPQSYPDPGPQDSGYAAGRLPPPAPVFAGWPGATLALLCTAGMATLIGWLPYLPVGDTRGWAVVYNLLDVDGPRTVATWWGTVLAVLVAVFAWAAAGRARRSRAWVRWIAWAVVGLTGLLYSASHLMALHQTSANLPFVAELGLPGLVTEHPVEFALLGLMALPMLALLTLGRTSQRLLLLLAALLFAIGSLLIGAGRWQVIDQPHYQHLAEVACEWLGMVCVLFAAARERVRTDWHD